jgi:endoglucanase
LCFVSIKKLQHLNWENQTENIKNEQMRNYLLRIITYSLVVWITGLAYGQSYNYAEVLQKSMFFYECQESGELWPDNRVTWRANSALNDGADVGLDLTGGWYDAGDHVKFNFPMAFSATALAWGGIDFKAGYETSGQLQYLKRNLRWVNDYFIKCHTAPNELWGQVGNGGTDHAWWGSAEVMKMDRPAYKIDASQPGSDLAAETAAAMAAASILFQDDDPSYAATLIQHAEQLYSFADNYRGVYSESITDAGGYYRSYSGYNDELVWGAIWLYRATGDQAYLDKAETYYANLGTEPQSDIKSYKWGIGWDDKSYGCYALLAKLTGKAKYIEAIERHLDYWTDGYNGQRISYTPGGLAYLDVWGALRYANNTGFLAMYYYDMASTSQKSQTYRDFAVNQADYALGDNPLSSSYVVGFGNNSTKNPHHRTAHGAWANNQIGPPADTRHTIYGAMVGGPNKDDSYEDDRSNYINNEVACDYNACFSGVMAALVEQYGGSPLTNFPVAEIPSDEYYTGAITNSKQDRFFEWSVQTFNHTAWPAREGNEYKFRLFVDITEGLNVGLTLNDYTVTTNNSGVVSITQLIPWDEANNIYYSEVTYLPGIEIWPGGDQYDSKEAQVRIGIPNDGPVEGWDVTNDPSYDPAMDSGDRNNPPHSQGIPLYVDGTLVFGNEPDGGNSIPAESITVDPISDTLDIAETLQITATVLPSDATNKNVTWTSSNTAVVTVNTTGFVTAVNPGSAIITAKTVSGAHTATCTVTVNELPVVEVSDVSLNQTSADLDINEFVTLVATVLPTDATDKSIVWTSSDTSIASVSPTGIVKGIGKGQATITAQSSNPDIAANCVVNVSNVVILPQYILNVTVSGSGSVELTPSGGLYEQGTQVTLLALPDDGWNFANWSGDLTGTDSLITITMDSDKDVAANFTESNSPGCSSYTSIDLPFSQDGDGEYCWVTSGDISYINSWNMVLLEINGVDFTNAWSNSFPPKINGNYYVHYQGEYPWSHFEIAGTKSTGASPVSAGVKVFPNPFAESAHLYIEDPESVVSLVIVDQLGRIVKNYTGEKISNDFSFGEDLSKGIYYMYIKTRVNSYNCIVNKN